MVWFSGLRVCQVQFVESFGGGISLSGPIKVLLHMALHPGDDGDRKRGLTVPQVTIKTGFIDQDGREEELTEYLCDYPNCPNIAANAFGSRELRQVVVVCKEHSPAARS